MRATASRGDRCRPPWLRGTTRAFRRRVVATRSGFVTRDVARCIRWRSADYEGVGRIDLARQGQFATPPDLRVARLAARQQGCVRFDQLVACGLDDSAIARRVRRGWLHRVHRGVYAVGFPPQTLHAKFMAAVLAGGEEASLSHWASCANAGLVRWDGRPIDVTLRGESHRSRPGIRFHRARSLDRRDTMRIHGIPCTTPARAILEIAPQLSDRRLKRLVRKAQAEKLARAGSSRRCCSGRTAMPQRAASRRSSPPGRPRPTAATRTRCSISCSRLGSTTRTSTSGSSSARRHAERRTSRTCAGRRNA